MHMSKPTTCITNSLLSCASRRRVLRGIAGGAVTAAFLTAGWTVDAASPPTTNVDGATSGIADGPVNVVLLFGHPDDPEAFEQYYLNKHVPIALNMPLWERMEGCKAVSEVSGALPSFYRISTLSYKSPSDMDASFGSAAGIEAFEDMANFATGGVTASIVRDVKTFHPTPEGADDRVGPNPR